MIEERFSARLADWDARTLELLEYEAALNLIAGHCRTHAGAALARLQGPTSDPWLVAEMGEQTAEARRLLAKEGVLLGGVTDGRTLVDRARSGGTLSPGELFSLAESVRGLRLTRRAIDQVRPPLARLGELAIRLPLLAELEAAIRSAVDETGVLDRASATLARLRAQIQHVESEIRRRLEALTRSAETAKMLQDPIVTQRRGRWVIPVRAEFRSQVPGIVHDLSQSGSTVFIEPQWAVEMANRLEDVRRAEQDEVERICRALATEVAAEHALLQDGFEAALELDLALARGELAEAWHANAATVAEDGSLYLSDARHPLLSGSVVPITVRLDTATRMVVITGPNTGGKTVTLKTTGLLALLFQTGCQLPVSEGSHLPVFRQVLADIGDDQSIAQNLSTFSSHMRRIIQILGRVEPLSLVLLDELGAGTDPQEGAALAGAVVQELLDQPMLGLATTHYPELKAMALTTPGLVNASVAFDLETLSPTYQLQIGVPGRSQAFAIAARLGLDPQVVERARERVAADQVHMEDVLAELDRERLRQAALRTEAEESVRRARSDEQKAKAASEEARQRAGESRDKARQEAQQLLSQARREFSEALREIRKVQQEKGAAEALEDVRKRLTAWDQRLADTAEAPPATVPLQGTLQVGDLVVVQRLARQGQLVEIDGERGEAVVEVGALRLRVPLASLQPGGRDEVAERAAWSQLAAAKAATVSPELHLIGLRVDEALPLLDKYLDDAVLAGLQRVRVVHGKGSGSLRRAIHEALANQGSVRHFALADAQSGGSGVTVIDL